MTPSSRPLSALGRLCARRPKTIVLLAAAVTIASVAVSVLRLENLTSRNALIAQDHDYNRRYLAFIREFGEQEHIALVVEVAGRPDRAVRFAETFVSEVSRGDRFAKILFRLSSAREDPANLVYLSTEELARLRDRFSAFDPRGLMEGIAAALEGHPRAEGGLGHLLGTTGGLDARGYYASEDGGLLFVFLDPRLDESALNPGEAAVRAAREALERTRRKHPEVAAGLTGRPVLDHDEMVSSERAMTYASVATFLFVVLLFYVVFRGFSQVLCAAVTIACAVAWSFGLTAVTIGHLNLLSMVFVVILISVGIDFGIHLIARYREARLIEGRSKAEAVECALGTTGRGVVTGGLTTAAAFLTSLLADFSGLEELGFIAGTGMILCLAANLTLLPALLVLTDRSPAHRWSSPLDSLLRPLSRGIVKRPRAAVLACLLLAGAGAVAATRLSFDYNLLDLLSPSLESVRYERMITERSLRSSLYGAITAETLEELRSKQARIEEAIGPSGRHREVVASIASILPVGLPEKRKILDDVRRAMEKNPPSVKVLLARLPAHDPTADRIRRALRSLPEAESARRLAGFEKALLSELRRFRSALAPRPFRVEDAPPELRERYRGRTGKFLLQVFPRKDIYPRGNMREFVEALADLDPAATGVPYQMYYASGFMKEGFERAALYAFAAIVLLLAIDFRRPGAVLLALTPLLVGLAWLLGLMWLTGWRFNLANFFAVPILLGIGVDDGIHLVHRARSRREEIPTILARTGSAVVLTSLTTMIGFLSIWVFSTHRGLESLGAILTLGIGTCLLGALVFLPALLSLLRR